MFLNNKKIPCLPPIYHHNNYITDFKEKAEIFNSLFAKQYTIVKKTSQLPTGSLKRTNNCLSTIPFTKDDIAKIIKNLDPNKAHGHDMISIRMLKICSESILKPLQLIFKSCIESGKLTKRKLSPDFVPAHCGKILERLIYDKMFEFFTENELISSNQSGFKPGAS